MSVLAALAAAALLGQSNPSIEEAGRTVFWLGVCESFGWTIDEPQVEALLLGVERDHLPTPADQVHAEIDAAGLEEGRGFVAAHLPVETRAQFVRGAEAMQAGCEARARSYPAIFLKTDQTAIFFEDYLARGSARFPE